MGTEEEMDMGMETGPERVRIGTVERETVKEQLGLHRRDGRIDDDELHERVERADAARTQGDLNALLTDLPDLGARPGDTHGGRDSTSSAWPVLDAPVAPVPAPPSGAVGTEPASAPVTEHPQALSTSDRMLAVSGSVATLFYLATGMLWGWWGWAWVVFLVPGILRAWTSAGGQRDRRDRRDRRC